MILVDSSIFIAIERGDSQLLGRLDSLTADDVRMSTITASELLHGVHRASSSARKAERIAFVEGLLVSFPALPFSLDAARIHAEFVAALKGQGIAVGVYDSLIAATALAFGASVVTRDKRDFSRIPGLQTMYW